MSTHVDRLEAMVREGVGFAELIGTAYALRFTGPVTVHFLNGQPQMAEFGRPLQVRFPEHPANKTQANSANSVDTQTGSTASSSP